MCDAAQNSPCKKGATKTKAWRAKEVGCNTKPRTRFTLGLEGAGAPGLSRSHANLQTTNTEPSMTLLTVVGET